jgi:hypothetical protein
MKFHVEIIDGMFVAANSEGVQERVRYTNEDRAKLRANFLNTHPDYFNPIQRQCSKPEAA